MLESFRRPGHLDYVCRIAVSECERLFPQWEFFIHPEEADARCNRRPGCVADRGFGYCACVGYGQTAVPDLRGPLCECSTAGGNPPSCRARR